MVKKTPPNLVNLKFGKEIHLFNYTGVYTLDIDQT